MTEKLYYKSSYTSSTDATVISCTECAGGYEIILDRTLFFAGSGGMESDLGTIDGHKVTKVFERGPDTVHIIEAPSEPYSHVILEIDVSDRMRKMQNHTGEHIISGLAHSLFGAENVGFHADEGSVTIDLNVKLTVGDIARLERLANVAVYENHPVRAITPTAEEASEISYRSKLDIKENLRLVIIEGIDICACSALHPNSTAEVGIIKILSHSPHRGGTRIIAACGISALENYLSVFEQNSKVSALLSAKQSATSDAVSSLLSENSSLKEKLSEAKRRLADLLIESSNKSPSLTVVISEEGDPDTLRYIATKCANSSTLGAALFPSDSSVRYAIASESVDLKALSKEMKPALNAKGGGSSTLVQGSFYTDTEKILDYLTKISL